MSPRRHAMLLFFIALLFAAPAQGKRKKKEGKLDPIPAAAIPAQKGSPGPSRLVVFTQNKMGNTLKLQELSLSLDLEKILHLTTKDKKKLAQKDLKILDREKLSPGLHRISVVMVYKGDGFGVFDYLNDYKFKITSSFSFQVEEGMITQIALIGYQKSDALIKFEDRPTVRYLVARDLSTESGLLDRDKDNVADDIDACPDQAGGPATSGCPDHDGDLIADRSDDCPNDVETLNAFEEEDGCPDEAPVAAKDPKTPKEPKSLPASRPVVADKEVTTEFFNPSGISSKAVRFGYDLEEPGDEFLPILDEIAKTLLDHPEIKALRIEGHTDGNGSEEYNQSLSERRAKAVARYLVSKGVSSSRLKSAGFGETKPAAPNDTEEDRAKNRRIEFVVVQ